jgi:hypothetical protein
VYRRYGCIVYRSIGADPVELGIPKLRMSDVSFQKGRRETGWMIALIDAYRGRRLDFDAYLYVVEVSLLPNLHVGRCGRGEGR